MIYLVNTLVASFLTLITVAVLPDFRIFGVVPLLPLFFLISLAYFRKGFEPVAIAALAGFFLDVFSGYPFGLYLATLLFIVVLVRFLFQEGMRSLHLGSYLSIAAGTLVVHFLAQLVLIYLEIKTVPLVALVSFGQFLAVNLVFAIIIYTFDVWYFDKIQEVNDILKRR